MGLWNSLLYPPGAKPLNGTFQPPEALTCPGPDDLLFVG